MKAEQGQADEGQNGTGQVEKANGAARGQPGQEGDEQDVGRNEEGLFFHGRRLQALKLKDKGDELDAANDSAVLHFVSAAVQNAAAKESEHDGTGQEEAGCQNAERRHRRQGLFGGNKAAAPYGGDDEKRAVGQNHGRSPG